MKINAKIIFVLVFLILLLIILTGCSSENKIIPTNAIIENNDIEYKIDYEDEKTFENDLNSGKDVIGKIVKFKVSNYVLDSLYGNNAWAGEHLNFISSDNPEYVENDIVICKIINVSENFDSWYINYEIIEIIKENTENVENNELAIEYYKDDESINLFIKKYNEKYDPDITSDMISKKHIGGRDSDHAVTISDDKLEVNIYGKGMFGNTMEVYIGYLPNSNYTQEDFKEKFIKYVGLFDDTLTEIDIISHWEKMTAEYCNYYEINNIEIWPWVNEGKVLYFKIISEIKL